MTKIFNFDEAESINFFLLLVIFVASSLRTLHPALDTEDVLLRLFPEVPHFVIECDPSRVDVEWRSGSSPVSACALPTLQHRTVC